MEVEIEIAVAVYGEVRRRRAVLGRCCGYGTRGTRRQRGLVDQYRSIAQLNDWVFGLSPRIWPPSSGNKR